MYKILNFTKSYFAILLVAFCLQKGYACQCIKVSWRFTDKLKNYQFIGMVEVFGFDTIGYSTYIKAKVIQQYRGEYLGAEILILHKTVIDCNGSIPYKSVGEKFRFFDNFRGAKKNRKRGR